MDALIAKHRSYGQFDASRIVINVDSYFSLHPNVKLQVSRLTTGQVAQAFLTDNITTRNNGIVLHQSISIGDPSSDVIPFWMQLHMLDSIKENIIRYQESKDTNDLLYTQGADR